MTLSEELKWRGLIQETTLKDLQALDSRPWVFYIGFDASAPSQTVGNLVALMIVKAFIRHGHKGIIIAGGATSLIGDPGGKDKERPLQSKEQIEANVAKALVQFKRILGEKNISYVNNLKWYEDFKLLDFLRDVGKHFSMTPLIQRDYIAQRLGEGGAGISFTEFSYTLLQGYDYLQLYDQYGCHLQIGGSDQWGNCLSGVDLIRRLRQTSVHALTLPLVINKATGKKFGKSEAGAVWLSRKMTHISDFYQFWLGVSDADVIDYLKIFTDLDRSSIDKLAKSIEKEAKLKLAQKALAVEMSKVVHGQKEMEICCLLADLAFKSPLNQPLKSAIDLLDQMSAEESFILDTKDIKRSLAEQAQIKIPFISSQRILKELLANKSVKLISFEQKSETYVNQIIEGSSISRAAEQISEIYNNDTLRPLIIVFGKNTIRPLKSN